MSYATSITVKKFLVTQTGTYNSQYRRPYISGLTSRTFNQIVDTVIQSPKVTPSVFTGFSNEIMAPSATPESQILIPNGWNERRFRFLLQLEVQYKTGGVIEQIITGWSETPANSLSFNNLMDPNTVFRVNNSLSVRVQQVRTNFGSQTHQSLSDCSHVLADNNWASITNSNANRLMRPTDIYSRMSVGELEKELVATNSYDASTTLSNVATKSRRSNGVTTNYLADITNSWLDASNQLGITEDTAGMYDAINTAQGYCRENSASRDPFLEFIANMNNTHVSDTFTLQDLYRLDPNLDQVKVVVNPNPIELGKLHSTGMTQDWGATDLHTHIATILCNSVPSIMMSFLLTRASFVSTNMDISGVFDTRIADAASFNTGTDLTPYIRGFITKMENDVLYDLARIHEIPIGLKMQVDLLGETWLSLTINNETIDYACPSFCDAMLVPVLTTNKDLSNNLANDFNTLLTSLTDNLPSNGFGSNQIQSGNRSSILDTGLGF